MYNLNYIFYLVGLFICVTNVTDAANVTQIDEEVDIESLYKALRQDAAKYRNKTPPKSPFCFPLCPQSNIQIVKMNLYYLIKTILVLSKWYSNAHTK